MYQLNNLFYGELDLSGGDIGSAATTITLSTGDVANLEITPTATDPALFTIWDKSYEHAGAARRDGGKVEIIEVTGKDEANDTLTAGTRGFSNTTAQSYNSTDNTTYGIVQISADELFDSLLIAGASNKIQDRSGTTLDTINAATMLQIGGADVYESSTYTPTVTPSTSGSITLSTTNDLLSYKVFTNDLVVIHGRLIVDSVTSPVGRIDISLPFAIASGTESETRSTGTVAINNVVAANISDFLINMVDGQSNMLIYLGDSTTVQGDAAEEVKASTQIYLNLSYTK